MFRLIAFLSLLLPATAFGSALTPVTTNSALMAVATASTGDTVVRQGYYALGDIVDLYDSGTANSCADTTHFPSFTAGQGMALCIVSSRGAAASSFRWGLTFTGS